jgi:hypothetical protein
MGGLWFVWGMGWKMGQWWGKNTLQWTFMDVTISIFLGLNKSCCK